MRQFLLTVSVFLFCWMCYVVVSTSIQSNLFTEWDYLASIPWMRATLWDFYANVSVLYLWIHLSEKSWWVRLLWLIGLICLGSIATLAYVIFRLYKLKPGEPLKNLFA